LVSVGNNEESARKAARSCGKPGQQQNHASELRKFRDCLDGECGNRKTAHGITDEKDWSGGKDRAGVMDEHLSFMDYISDRLRSLKSFGITVANVVNCKSCAALIGNLTKKTGTELDT
jgi:hypothetical protein